MTMGQSTNVLSGPAVLFSLSASEQLQVTSEETGSEALVRVDERHCFVESFVVTGLETVLDGPRRP